MKPRLVHKEAMEFSYKAKEAIDAGDFSSASEYYTKAAEKEGELARFYFDKPELEPTRSTIVRSAAFLHLKAGLIPEAQQLIYRGLLDLQNEEIKQQLEEALELSISLKNVDLQSVGNADYFKLLRMRSINYTMEPVKGRLASLEMLKDFANDYLRSLKAYAAASYKRAEGIAKKTGKKLDDAVEQFEQLVNPLITTTGIGSFSFAIANDFLSRGEDEKLTRLKANILIDYHEKIFVNPLSDAEIALFKKEFKDDEINQIFKPITKIKAPSSPYKLAYYDIDAYRKKYIPQIDKDQKKKLLPLNPPSSDDIGVLESFIIHARKLNGGKKKRNVIQKEQLKTYELEFKTNQIEPKDARALLLNEEILIDVQFDTATGFSFFYEELDLSYTNTDYEKGLQTFYTNLHERLIGIIKDHFNNKKDSAEWRIVSKLINNPQGLLK